MDGKNRKDIYPGIKVQIITKENRRDDKEINGIVKEILTNSEYHPHGILVRLISGEVGRVKIIVNENANGFSILPSKNTVSESTPVYINITDIHKLSENEVLEFKSSVLWSQNHSNEQILPNNSRELKQYGSKASKIIIAKSIAAFLNSQGGNLVIGVKENKIDNTNEIIGIEPEFEKLRNADHSIDGYRRMIQDEIIKPYFPASIRNHLSDSINFEFPEIDNKILCWIKIRKSDTKVFIKIENKDHFFKRSDSESIELQGEEVVDYITKHFNY